VYHPYIEYATAAIRLAMRKKEEKPDQDAVVTLKKLSLEHGFAYSSAAVQMLQNVER
jgi:hypothetical protein